ncbi:MAG: hypothetical protein QM702_04475 [Rubrivivax sp.]
MPKYECLRPVSDGKGPGGEPHPVGTVIELTEQQAQPLIDDGALKKAPAEKKKDPPTS